MSGGAKGAKRPLGRPLDGGVRRHGECNSTHALASPRLRSIVTFNDDEINRGHRFAKFDCALILR